MPNDGDGSGDSGLDSNNSDVERVSSSGDNENYSAPSPDDAESSIESKRRMTDGGKR